jgi:Phosphotransferase enzyme family
LLKAIEQSLGRTWHGDVVLEPAGERGLSGREYVHRFRVRNAPTDSPASVIVKQPRPGDADRTLFFTEWACLQLLTELCAESPAPRLFCGSTDPAFVVMEDFGSGERLDNGLLGSDATRASQTLVGLLETVGSMHAATVGKRDRFDAILKEYGVKHPDSVGRRQRLYDAIRDALDRLALRPDPSFLDELLDIDRRASSKEQETLIHGDPCPDNCQWVGDRVRLLDFEHGRFGNPYSDACYPIIHFPTCWCMGRLPDDVVEQAVEAYRRVRSVEREQLDRGMTDASILWAWSTFAGWHMPKVLSEDHEWGLATVRQRILFRFRLVVDMLERDGRCPGIVETTRRIHEILSARWRDVADIPLYPAFRS